MDGLHICLVVLLGVVSHSHGWNFGPVLEVTVRPGDNIALHCDCKLSSGVFIVWYRNCSHENQPALVLKTIRDPWTRNPNDESIWNLPPRFHFMRNTSSESYDLLIMNITESDLGFYYCGTEETKVEDKESITSRYVYRYGNVTTRIIFSSSESHSRDSNKTPRDFDVCWSLLFALCPALAVLSSLLSSLVVYHLCHKKAKEPEVEKPETRGRTRLNQDEDVCYAALEIQQPSQRPKKKKKKIQSSDFSTYSAINTSRM